MIEFVKYLSQLHPVEAATTGYQWTTRDLVVGHWTACDLEAYIQLRRMHHFDQILFRPA